MFFHTNGDVPDNVFVQAHLPFHFSDGSMWRINVEQLIVTLAVLLHLVGEIFQTPIFTFGDGAAIFGNDV